MQNSMVLFTLSVFDWKYFFGKFGLKKQNCQFESKFYTRLIWYVELLRKYVVVTFSILDQNNGFGGNLVRKIKIISLSRNLVTRLISICEIQWWCSLFQFSTGNTSLGKFGPKNQNCQFELKFRTRLIWICRIM